MKLPSLKKALTGLALVTAAALPQKSDAQTVRVNNARIDLENAQVGVYALSGVPQQQGSAIGFGVTVPVVEDKSSLEFRTYFTDQGQDFANQRVRYNGRHWTPVHGYARPYDGFANGRNSGNNVSTLGVVIHLKDDFGINAGGTYSSYTTNISVHSFDNRGNRFQVGTYANDYSSFGAYVGATYKPHERIALKVDAVKLPNIVDGENNWTVSTGATFKLK